MSDLGNPIEEAMFDFYRQADENLIRKAAFGYFHAAFEVLCASEKDYRDFSENYPHLANGIEQVADEHNVNPATLLDMLVNDFYEYLFNMASRGEDALADECADFVSSLGLDSNTIAEAHEKNKYVRKP